MADHKVAYGTTSSYTVTGLNSLATSSTLVAGYELAAVTNDQTGEDWLDQLIDGDITVGTTPTAGTVVEIWVIPQRGDASWPDVFDGTASAETVTARAILLNFAGLLARIDVDTNTSNRVYPFSGSVLNALQRRDGSPVSLPRGFVLFITHSTAVNLNASATGIRRTPVYMTTA